MRIGIGAVLGVLGGPATYARELVRALARIDVANEYVVITDAPDQLEDVATRVHCVRAPLSSSWFQPLWDHIYVPYYVRRHGLDLYHGTKGTLPFRSGCRTVVTVHDLAVYDQPETFSWLQRMHLRSHTPLAVRGAARVIADSEFARRDLLERFALPADKVVTIPLAVGPAFTAVPSTADTGIAAAFALPPRYLLYAGTIQPRKNVEELVAAFGALSDSAGVELLIAGRVRPGYRPGFLRQPPPRVRYLGTVSDAELAVLYRRAIALCSPSKHEGFGLSLLEAMASGCLVLAGRNSAVPELLGDCGILLPDVTARSLRAALEQLVTQSDSFDDLRQRARRRAAQYSWETTARRTLSVYQQVLADLAPRDAPTAGPVAAAPSMRRVC